MSIHRYIQPVKFKTELKKSSAILQIQEYVNENIGNFLDGEEISFEYIDEFGSSNFFGIKNNTYVTPLSDSVLPSITNKCLQEIAADLGLKVEKRPVRLEELEEFEEVGGCGTAVVINPMSHIEVKEVLEEEPVKKVYRFCPDGEVGPVSTRLYKTITGIQKGEIEDIHGWCYEIKDF